MRDFFYFLFFFFTLPYWDIGSDSSPCLVVQGESVFSVTFTCSAGAVDVDDDGTMNGADDDGTMKDNKIQGGLCWYRLIFIKSGSRSPDV